MTLYERIPGGTLEAIQWTGDNPLELNEWTKWEGSDGELNAGFLAPNDFSNDKRASIWVAANGAWLRIDVSEWVAKDSLGFYPIKDEQFRKSWQEPKPVFDDPRSDGQLLDDMGIDAMVWAEEFAKRFTIEGGDVDTVGLMLGWFANAIQTGISEGHRKEVDPKTHEVDLDAYTNSSRAGDNLAVRVGDQVHTLLGYWQDDRRTVARIYKPTSKSRVRYVFTDGGEAHAHNYGKVSNG